MSRVFLDADDAGVEYAWFDDATGDLLSIERVEDVEQVLEDCKRQFNEGLVNQKSEFRRVSSYPPNALRLWAKQKGLNWYGIGAEEMAKLLCKDEKLTSQLLNDRDLSGFRTLPGRY